MSDVFKVASVHFAPLLLKRPAYGGIYAIDGVKPGGPPAILKVENRVQIERGGFTDSPNPRTRSTRRDVIYAVDIAFDLVNEWTNLIADGRKDPPTYPGVWVVRDKVLATDAAGVAIIDAENKQTWRDATREEAMAMWNEDLERCRLADSNYARAIFDAWNARIEQHPDMVKTLPKAVRLAAEAYGWTADWLRDSTIIETKDCQFCGKKVRKQVIVCPQCHQVIDYEAFAKERAKQAEVNKKHGVVDFGAAAIAGVTERPPQAA
jgi:hypothetical protein